MLSIHLIMNHFYKNSRLNFRIETDYRKMNCTYDICEFINHTQFCCGKHGKCKNFTCKCDIGYTGNPWTYCYKTPNQGLIYGFVIPVIILIIFINIYFLVYKRRRNLEDYTQI